jgi:HK97 family phage portal protein
VGFRHAIASLLGRERRDQFYREGIPPLADHAPDVSATSVIAVYACVGLLADTVATLPVDVIETDGAERVPVPVPSWLETPAPGDPSITLVDHLSQVVWSLGLDGNAFVLALPDVSEPVTLAVGDPGRIEVRGTPAGPVYDYMTTGGTVRYTSAQVIHIPLYRPPGAARGMSPIERAQRTIQTKASAERFGRAVFGNGMLLSGAITVPGPLSEPQLRMLREEVTAQYVGAHNAWKPGIFAGGAKWDVPQLSLEQMQFLALQGWGVNEIARLYRIPPHLIGDVERSTSWGTGIEQQTIGFLRYTVRSYLVRIEAAYRRLLPPGQSVRFSVDGFLRGDVKSRYEAYQIALNAQIMTRDEVRALEDLPPVADAPGPWLQTPNNTPAEAIP